MPASFEIQLHGFDAVRKALRGQELYAEPFRDTMVAIGQIGESAAARAAPKGRTGQLEAQITYKVQQRPIPLWVAIRERAKRRSTKYPRGYPYGRLLNYAPKYGHLGWFTDPMKRLAHAAVPAFNTALKQIADRWERVA